MNRNEVEALFAELAGDFRELDDEDGWILIEDIFEWESRWCTHWRKVVQHASGYAVAIEYARNTGDGDSASAYEDVWYEVEPYQETVTKWRRVQGPPKESA